MAPSFLSSCFVLEKKFKVEKGEYVKKPTFSICSSMLCNYAGVIAKILQTLKNEQELLKQRWRSVFGPGQWRLVFETANQSQE